MMDKNSFINLLGLDGSVKAANDLSNKCKNTLDSFDDNLKDSLKELLDVYLNRHIKNK